MYGCFRTDRRQLATLQELHQEVIITLSDFALFCAEFCSLDDCSRLCNTHINMSQTLSDGMIFPGLDSLPFCYLYETTVFGRSAVLDGCLGRPLVDDGSRLCSSHIKRSSSVSDSMILPGLDFPSFGCPLGLPSYLEAVARMGTPCR